MFSGRCRLTLFLYNFYTFVEFFHQSRLLSIQIRSKLKNARPRAGRKVRREGQRIALRNHGRLVRAPADDAPHGNPCRGAVVLTLAQGAPARNERGPSGYDRSGARHWRNAVFTPAGMSPPPRSRGLSGPSGRLSKRRSLFRASRRRSRRTPPTIGRPDRGRALCQNSRQHQLQGPLCPHLPVSENHPYPGKNRRSRWCWAPAPRAAGPISA